MVPIPWSVAGNTFPVEKIGRRGWTHASTTNFLINKGVRTPLTLLGSWIPEIRLLASNAPAVVLIGLRKRAYALVGLLIVNERGWTFLAVLFLVIPKKWLVAGQTNLIPLIRRIDGADAFAN